MITRRQALRASLFGSGLIGLRALATGLPAAFLLTPSIARSEPACAAMANAQFLILSMSNTGDALNCNVPGTYDAAGAPNLRHPAAPEMAPTTLSLRGVSYKAAAPWKTLPQAVLDRTAFFHHRTQTGNHAELGKVLELMGKQRDGEQIPSFYAKHLQPCLSTVQAQPISLGPEVASFNSRYLPRLSPTGLKSALTGKTGLAKDIQKLRDSSLDKMNALFKERRSQTTAERAFLDQMVISQQQLRTLTEQIATDLETLTANDEPNQVAAAVLLARMKVTPVITLHLPFSGDNHRDADLERESRDTVEGVGYIALLMGKLAQYGLTDQVTFATLNVFGRTMDTTFGREHNPHHSVSVIIGKNVKGGVVGGMGAGRTGVCADINSTTGAPGAGGDVPAVETLPALAKTLGAALGLPQQAVDAGITSGKVVRSMLA